MEQEELRSIHNGKKLLASPELSNVYCKKREGERQALHTPTDRANLGLQCDKRSQHAYGVNVRVGTVLDIGVCKCFCLAAIRD